MYMGVWEWGVVVALWQGDWYCVTNHNTSFHPGGDVDFSFQNATLHMWQLQMFPVALLAADVLLPVSLQIAHHSPASANQNTNVIGLVIS